MLGPQMDKVDSIPEQMGCNQRERETFWEGKNQNGILKMKKKK